MKTKFPTFAKWKYELENLAAELMVPTLVIALILGIMFQIAYGDSVFGSH